MDGFTKERYSIIEEVIKSFYSKATKDIIIGYHFRHIDNFETHLPRITRFWAVQLIEMDTHTKKNIFEDGVPSDIIKKHVYLKVKKGEIGRWILLFQKSIEEFFEIYKPNKLTIVQTAELKTEWLKKSELFHRKFLDSNLLF